MISRLQRLPLGPRIVIFVFMLVGGVLLLGGLTLFLLTLTLNSAPRQTARALIDTVTVAQFAALPDDNAYPSTVAAGVDGAVYTASFTSGAVWKITPGGQTNTELPNARDQFDSVTALAVRPDDTLLVVAFAGGDAGAWAIYSLTQGGQIAQFGTIEDTRGFVSPFDIALDPDGGVYVVDRSRAEIWRWDADGGNPDLWWSLLSPPVNGTPDETLSTTTPDERPAPTGLAYDLLNDALLVTDPDLNIITRIPRSRLASELVFRSDDAKFPPGFDGIAVAPDGAIYVTALDQKGVALITLNPAALTYVAGNFRGPSDLAFTPDGRLVVANFDSLALAQPGIRPQLPFALDVLSFK